MALCSLEGAAPTNNEYCCRPLLLTPRLRVRPTLSSGLTKEMVNRAFITSPSKSRHHRKQLLLLDNHHHKSVTAATMTNDRIEDDVSATPTGKVTPRRRILRHRVTPHKRKMAFPKTPWTLIPDLEDMSKTATIPFSPELAAVSNNSPKSTKKSISKECSSISKDSIQRIHRHKTDLSFLRPRRRKVRFGSASVCSDDADNGTIFSISSKTNTSSKPLSSSIRVQELSLDDLGLPGRSPPTRSRSEDCCSKNRRHNDSFHSLPTMALYRHKKKTESQGVDKTFDSSPEIGNKQQQKTGTIEHIDENTMQEGIETSNQEMRRQLLNNQSKMNRKCSTIPKQQMTVICSHSQQQSLQLDMELELLLDASDHHKEEEDEKRDDHGSSLPQHTPRHRRRRRRDAV